MIHYISTLWEVHYRLCSSDRMWPTVIVRCTPEQVVRVRALPSSLCCVLEQDTLKTHSVSLRPVSWLWRIVGATWQNAGDWGTGGRGWGQSTRDLNPIQGEYQFLLAVDSKVEPRDFASLGFKVYDVFFSKGENALCEKFSKTISRKGFHKMTRKDAIKTGKRPWPYFRMENQ